MSTPNEGPARSWTPGDVQKAAEVFAGLNHSEQEALMRSIRTHEILAPMHNAIERTVAFTRASIEGLSDYAQPYIAGARAWGQAKMERAGQARENASNRSNQLSEGAKAKVKQAREGLSGVVEWSKTTVSNVTNQALEAGRQKVDAGRETAGKVGRWFNNKISNAAMKASATFAGIAARRQDPALQGPDLKLPDNLRIAQHMTEIASAQTPDQLNNAMASLSTFANERLSQMQGTQSGVAEAQNAARLLQGVAPASEIPGKYAPQTGGPAQGQQHGEAANLTKQQKPSGQTTER